MKYYLSATVVVATQPLEGLDMDKIIAMMVGRSLNQRFPDKEISRSDVILGT